MNFDLNDALIVVGALAVVVAAWMMWPPLGLLAGGALLLATGYVRSAP